MIIWIIGMSASGKTVVGEELYKLIKNERKNTVILDGDIFRGLSDNDADHTVAGRKKNSDRLCRMCQFLDKQNINVVVAVLSIFHQAQAWNKENYRQYFEVFLDVPLELLKQRDPKGLYRKAAAGEMPNMVGFDIEFPPPRNPDLVIHNDGSQTPALIAEQIFSKVKDQLE